MLLVPNTSITYGYGANPTHFPDVSSAHNVYRFDDGTHSGSSGKFGYTGVKDNQGQAWIKSFSDQYDVPSPEGLTTAINNSFLGRGLQSAASLLGPSSGSLRANPGAPSGGSPGGPVPSPSSPSAASVDYYNADLAKFYGMNKGVAYQEALSNTAYQRAVKDMQAAGLNPASLFGAGRASAADGVGYVASSGGSSGGSSSALRMSKIQYSQFSGMNKIIGMGLGAAAGAVIPGLSVYSGAMLGAMIAQGYTSWASQR